MANHEVHPVALYLEAIAAGMVHAHGLPLDVVALQIDVEWREMAERLSLTDEMTLRHIEVMHNAFVEYLDVHLSS